MRRILLVMTLVLAIMPAAQAHENADDGSAGAAVAMCAGLEATIVGTDRRDVIMGTPGDDVIWAGAGNDIVNGRGGDDIICGGPGRDKLIGARGNDVLIGGEGADRLRGGGGDDLLDGGTFRDRLAGGAGDDVCVGSIWRHGCENRKPMVRPVDAGVTSFYGWRWHPIYLEWMMHSGWDFDAACGTEIRSPAAGEVTWAGWMDDRTGIAIRLDHGQGLGSSYAHLSEVGVSVGDYVDAGDVIGLVGTTGASTGCHLHYGMKQGGLWIDPTQYLCPAIGAPSVSWDRDGCPDGEPTAAP